MIYRDGMAAPSGTMMGSEATTRWGEAPREVLVAIFAQLPLQDRCQSVGAVCSWWRQVALEAGPVLLLDLNLNRLPLFAKRAQSLGPDFFHQRTSFTVWLLKRRSSIRRLSLTAERWEDDSQAVTLRLAVAEVVASQLESLKLICTDSGRTTTAFLSAGTRLRDLQLDFWGRTNGLPRALSSCTALTHLAVQCSSGLERFGVLTALTSLQDLSVIDGNWPNLPTELLVLPLTRLHLRFADFSDGAFSDVQWLPADAGKLKETLQELSLVGCQVSELPDSLGQLSCLTSLRLDRNFLRGTLPPTLSRLRRLASLSLEGCCSLRELPAALLAALPLRSLNILHTGVLRLPVATGVPALQGLPGSSGSKTTPGDSKTADEDAGNSGSSSGKGGNTNTSTTAAIVPDNSSVAGYLSQLTELRWGCPEWEQATGGRPSGGARRWVGPAGALSTGANLPDLAPVLQASALQVLQLLHVPASAEGQVQAVRQRLPLLTSLHVNSAILLP